MDERDERLLADDAEFKRLFSSLDEVRATDELKSATLAAIFAQMDEEAGDKEGEPAASVSSGTRFTLVEGGAGEDCAEAAEASAGSETMEVESRQPRLVEGGGRRTGQRHMQRLRLRVAAGLVALAIGLGGGVAYATPVTHVTATAGETTYDLGVNLFGLTVSAEADSEDGRQVLEGLQLRHVRFEDAFDRLLDACEVEGEGASALKVSVEGRGPFGDTTSISEKAQDIAKAHEHASNAANGAPAAAQSESQSRGGDADAQHSGGAGEQAQAQTSHNDSTPLGGGDQQQVAEGPSAPEKLADEGAQPSGEAGKPNATGPLNQGDGPGGTSAGPEG